MSIHFCTFATSYKDLGFDDRFYYQKLQIKSARKFGLTDIEKWDRTGLAKTKFYRDHKTVLDQKKGAGYWLWKPYIIKETLDRVKPGDFVFYLDADIKIIADPSILFDLCQENNGFFLIEEQRYFVRNWVKRDCFIWMGLDDNSYFDAPMSAGGLQIYQKNTATVKFVEELLKFSSLNEEILTDVPNIMGKPNHPEFVEHRHDQSILTLLKLKYGIRGFRWPTQWGNHEKLEGFRVPGEYLVSPYNDYVDEPIVNSPYGTLLWGMDKSFIPYYYRIYARIWRMVARFTDRAKQKHL